MAIKMSPAPKLPKPSGFSLPKQPTGRPMSGSIAFRASASGYGKLFKLSGGETAVKSQPPSKFRASY